MLNLLLRDSVSPGSNARPHCGDVGLDTTAAALPGFTGLKCPASLRHGDARRHHRDPERVSPGSNARPHCGDPAGLGDVETPVRVSPGSNSRPHCGHGRSLWGGMLGIAPPLSHVAGALPSFTGLSCRSHAEQRKSSLGGALSSSASVSPVKYLAGFRAWESWGSSGRPGRGGPLRVGSKPVLGVGGWW